MIAFATAMLLNHGASKASKKIDPTVLELPFL
jgi:hypothetical protein